MKRFAPSPLHAVALCAASLFASIPAARAETVRIAFIEVLSGPFGLTGQGSLSELREVVRQVNASSKPDDPTFEIVPLDGKGTPQESAVMLRSAIDQGIRYVTQGGGSGVAFTLVDALNKQAQRQPDQPVLLLNYAAADPALTGEHCSYWHFRFYPSSEMQINALTNYLSRQPEVKRVYLLNQNYAHGQQVAKAARTFLAKKRPDVEIVGEDFVPIASVRDFAPYIAKMATTKADTVITSNWGSDLSLLIKSAQDYGLQSSFYTLSGINPGIPTQVGAWGVGRMHVVWNWLNNATGTPALEKIAVDYKAATGLDFINVAHLNSIYMLREAIRSTRSSDPRKVARALEGMKYAGPLGAVEMRAGDHQLQSPIYLGTWDKLGSPGVRHAAEKTAFGYRVAATTSADEAAMPAECRMARPEP